MEGPSQPYVQPQPQPRPQAAVHTASTPAKSGDTFWKITTVVLMVVLAVFAFKISFGSSLTGATIGVPTSIAINNNLEDVNKIVADLKQETTDQNILVQLNKLDTKIKSVQAELESAPIKPTPSPSLYPAPSPSPKLDLKALLDDDAVKGDPDAPVTIIEFSDYECPFCARFYSQTLGQIDEQYIKTGKVKLVYRDFPLSFHQQAQKAAEAAECAGEEGKYYEMHDKLFVDGVQGGVTSFKQYAKDLGLDTPKFDKCLDSGAMAAEVQKDEQDGIAAGIQGTPGFFVNGVPISGAQPFSVFKQIIDQQLAAAN